MAEATIGSEGRKARTRRIIPKPAIESSANEAGSVIGDSGLLARLDALEREVHQLRARVAGLEMLPRPLAERSGALGRREEPLEDLFNRWEKAQTVFART